MFAPKVREGEKEYKNEIMVWDPFLYSYLEKTSEEREAIRLSEPEKGHVWLSIDPAETNIGIRMEKRFSGSKIQGLRSNKVSIYNDIFEFRNTVPAYGLLDEAKCEHVILQNDIVKKCKNNAKWLIYNNDYENGKNGKKYFCGTHSKPKIHPHRKEIIHGRKAVAQTEGKFRKMREYENILLYFKSIDLSQVRFVVIETQLAVNYRSTRISQFIISALMQLLNNKDNTFFPIIYEINAKIKSRVYGVNLPKPELKKWAMRKAIYSALVNGEIEFLELLLKDDWPETLLKMYQKGELTEAILWDIIEPERNTVVTKEKAKIRKEQGVLSRSMKELFDICDAKEQIESLVIEIGLNRLYNNNINGNNNNTNANNNNNYNDGNKAMKKVDKSNKFTNLPLLD